MVINIQLIKTVMEYHIWSDLLLIEKRKAIKIKHRGEKKCEIERNKQMDNLLKT